MKIKEIPWYNRPGARLRQKGVHALSDAELLAIVLGRGDINENAIDLSNRVLSEKNFLSLATLSIPELEQMFRHPVKALKIQAMFEIFRRANKLQKKGFRTQIKNAEDVFRYYVDEMQGKMKEHFYALLLDTKNRIIREELLSVGTLNASLIHPREVFNPAIKASANTIILIHNHPSGDCSPSSADEEVTKLLTDAGDLLGITVLDHIIIGKDTYYSFKQHHQ